MKSLIASACALTALFASAASLTNREIPVCATNNLTMLSSLTERPWWNEAWTKRLPILVASQSSENDDKVVVDAVIDFGESVDPAEVRVVTPWETLVPCVATSTSTSTSLRLLFKTSLRTYQNKPFLVYYGNKQAKAEKVADDVTLEQDDDSIRIRNGVVDVTFDRKHVTEGLIRRLRIPASRCNTVLFDGANGYAKGGFVFSPNGGNGWDKGTVVLDNALAKAVRFDCKDASVTFTLYSEQPRVDWKYELKNGNNGANINMNWLPGNGSSFDDFYYCGRTGKILTQRAGLDFVSDCMPCPQGRFHEWLGEGWYAYGERRMADIVGFVFDHEAADFLEYTSYYGLSTHLRLSHRLKAGETASGSGAIVAAMGDAEEFRRIYKRIVKPVVVSVGEAQAKVAKPYIIPRLDHDWCVDYNTGWNYGGDSGTSHPLMKDPEWANHIVNRLRSYGSTCVCLLGYGWWTIPIEDKALYDRIEEARTTPGMFESWVAQREFSSWPKAQTAGAELRMMLDAIHAKGLGAHMWTSIVPGWSDGGCKSQDTQKTIELSADISVLRARFGFDCAYSLAMEGEGVHLPSELVKKNGSTSYWTWKNPQEAFDAFDHEHKLMEVFYKRFKKECPDVPVFLWNSEDGEYGREKFMAEEEGWFDTMVVEMLPGQGFGHIKHVSKRMRSHFNNVEGHTVWHHYYVMNPKTEQRVFQLEWPFICGVNGFSQENLTYETTDIETSEMEADFFRFMEYTRLGEKVARMAPVKNLGVYRDPKMFREDVLKNRLKKPYPYGAQQDGRVRSFSELANFNYDVIGPKFFTAKDLAKYRVVYIPEDEVMNATEAKELLEYVKNGGSAILEGERAEGLKGISAEGLEDGKIAGYGKGKILWYKEVRTDRIAKKDGKVMKEVRKTIADMGGVEPYAITGGNSWLLDGNLQSGPEGMFLGLYNRGDKPATGTVKISEEVRVKSEELRNFYVLDVKTGERQFVTNGTFEVSVGMKNTGYYLIGDEKFTAVPKARAAGWLGAEIAAVHPRMQNRKEIDVGDFKPDVSIEFVNENQKGELIRMQRTIESKDDVRRFSAKSYTAKDMKAALSEAKYINFIDQDPKSSDPVFTECAAELKELLKRGGSIIFTRSATGEAARKFLEEVEVFDPNPSEKRNVGDTWARWCGPKDHPFLTSCLKVEADEPDQSKDLSKWWQWKHVCDYFQYNRVFTKWDAAKQQALFRPKNDGEGCTTLVVQENVLGKGKVVFNENARSFTDFYESKRYCVNLLAWLTGTNPDEHAKKVTEMNGGLGEVWKK